MLESSDIADKIFMLHQRKGDIGAQMVEAQSKISAQQGAERAATNSLIQNFKKEQTLINEQLKAYSVLYRRCIDTILISLLKNNYPNEYSELKTKAKAIYEKRNQ